MVLHAVASLSSAYSNSYTYISPIQFLWPQPHAITPPWPLPFFLSSFSFHAFISSSSI
ncbi:uncharacterized protein DS421_11g330810 [Arachis hypogaea]|nr:uncharacterized protein DS421_11g330810 [Arachis hypogaea]